MVMLLRWPINGENGHSTEVASGGSGHSTEAASLMEGELMLQTGQFNSGRMVMLRRWTV